jgi:hypothetical protein
MFQDAKWFQQFACTNHRRLPHTEIPKESWSYSHKFQIDCFTCRYFFTSSDNY